LPHPAILTTAPLVTQNAHSGRKVEVKAKARLIEDREREEDMDKNLRFLCVFSFLGVLCALARENLIPYLTFVALGLCVEFSSFPVFLLSLSVLCDLCGESPS